MLKAPLERVWQAISDAVHFGARLGREIEGSFVAGRTTIGRIVPTRVDAEMARLQEPYRGAAVELIVELVAMQRFAVRGSRFAGTRL